MTTVATVPISAAKRPPPRGRTRAARAGASLDADLGAGLDGGGVAAGSVGVPDVVAGSGVAGTVARPTTREGGGAESAECPNCSVGMDTRASQSLVDVVDVRTRL
jgi:hypothetical protein